MAGYRVPFVDAREHYRRLKPEVDAALTDTLARGDLVARQQLRDFERHLADYVGVKYAVGVSSGYHALQLSMLAAGIGPGDEVITSGHTFVATVSAIVHTGATPVLVDVGDDHNMDPDAVAAALTPRTKAIVPVHLNGRVCDMARLGELAARHGLLIIEDAAQALGATFGGRMAGSFGTAGCFSFYPFKALGCFGDGGAVTTDDPDLARAVTRLRFNGEDRETGEYHYHGYTALLDNIQAAVLDVKLRHFPCWVRHRRAMTDIYRQALADVDGIRLPFVDGDSWTARRPNSKCAPSSGPGRAERAKQILPTSQGVLQGISEGQPLGWFDTCQNYVVRAERRDELRDHLREEGVETLVSWSKPMWRHEALGLADPGLPGVEQLCREVISLPLNAEISREQVEIVADAVRAFYGR